MLKGIMVFDQNFFPILTSLSFQSQTDHIDFIILFVHAFAPCLIDLSQYAFLATFQSDL